MFYRMPSDALNLSRKDANAGVGHPPGLSLVCSNKELAKYTLTPARPLGKTGAGWGQLFMKANGLFASFLRRQEPLSTGC